MTLAIILAVAALLLWAASRLYRWTQERELCTCGCQMEEWYSEPGKALYHCPRCDSMWGSEYGERFDII